MNSLNIAWTSFRNDCGHYNLRGAIRKHTFCIRGHKGADQMSN